MISFIAAFAAGHVAGITQKGEKPKVPNNPKIMALYGGSVFAAMEVAQKKPDISPLVIAAGVGYVSAMIYDCQGNIRFMSETS